MLDFERFLNAQATLYHDARIELSIGRKQTHWMWFVFPQLGGLGSSELAKKYGIKDLSEATEYLDHPILGNRLRECVGILLKHENRTAIQIMGTPDDIKLCSSLTLFERASTNETDKKLFHDGIKKFFNGRRDDLTIKLLDEQAPQ